MKQIKVFLLIAFCGLAFQGFSIVPEYYGARSLSMGYASTAFNYDVNSIFLDPANLSALPYSLSGYQYQQSFLDYKGFSDELSDVLGYDLENFEGLSTSNKQAAFSGLANMFQGKTGMYGFTNSILGFTAGNYGVAVSFVNTAVVNPVTPLDADFFDRDVDEITNTDISQLQMSFIGLKYKKFSLSYALEVYQSLSLGVSVHYLNGKVTRFDRSILDDVFTPDNDTQNYLEHAWKNTEEKFSQFVVDVGLNMDLGRYFRIGLTYRNVGAAKISIDQFPTLKIPRRIIAGLAFRPDEQWGLYVDIDLRKTDLLYNGQEWQPISFGIEKSFFQNQFFIRAGLLNDLTEKKFFGSKANTLYGMGIGFNMKRIVVDLGIGIDSTGSVKNLAVSGFFIVN